MQELSDGFVGRGRIGRQIVMPFAFENDEFGVRDVPRELMRGVPVG